MKQISRYRWFVVGVFFVFMLLHQADKLLIGSLTTPIMRDFNLDEAQMGFITTGALIVGAICYPLWGYLYDRYARSKLLALASLIWGCTTWLSAIARTPLAFTATRASTGIDDSSYPGLYSMVTDYFQPDVRGKVYGLLQLTGPIGFLIGMILGLFLSDMIGWRGIFYITGSLGVVVAIVIFFGVREPARGQSEPEMADLEHIAIHRFNWATVRGLFQKRSLRILFIQGFFGVFPWNVITYWFIRYLQTERNYDDQTVFITMGIAVVVLAASYPLGGALGDYFFKRSPGGRALVSMVGVLAGAVLLALALSVPQDQPVLFIVMLALTCIAIPIASPNVISTVYDVTLPEVRSTALSIQYLIESSGAALAPGIAGLIAREASLKAAFLIICISTWILCGIFFWLVARYVPQDVHTLREQMRQRALEEQGTLEDQGA